jgi:hypothetical protein
MLAELVSRRDLNSDREGAQQYLTTVLELAVLLSDREVAGTLVPRLAEIANLVDPFGIHIERPPS